MLTILYTSRWHLSRLLSHPLQGIIVIPCNIPQTYSYRLPRLSHNKKPQTGLQSRLLLTYQGSPNIFFFLNRTSIPSSTRNIVFLLQLQIATHVSPFWNTVVLTVWDEDPWEFLRAFTEFVRVSLF